MASPRASSPPSPPVIDPALLDALLRRRSPVTVETLALERRSTREQTLRQLARLRRADCELELHPQHGVRLARAGLSAWQDYIQWRCPLPGGQRRIVEVYRQTASTQDTLRRLIESLGPASRGAVVTADDQTAGRGRLGRRWVAPPGACVTFSYAACDDEASRAMTVDRLMFATALAVAQAVELVALPTRLEARIKWPNDVLVNDRKIAGILVETAPCPWRPGRSVAVIGVGVNVSLDPHRLPPDAPPELALRATSLLVAGADVDRLRVLAETVRQMDAALAQSDVRPMLDAWRRRSVLLSRRVTLVSDGRRVEGVVEDLDPYAGLIVRTDTGALIHLPAATTTIE